MSADTPEPVTGQSTDTPEPVTGQAGTTDGPRAKSAGEAASSPAGEAASRPAGKSGRVGLAARRQARRQARRAARTGGGPEADQASARGVDWVSLGAVVLLLGAAGATHGAVFGDTSGYTAVAGGIALGSLIGLAGARWRWSLLETLLATTLTYLLAGGALALPATTTSRLVPTLATLQGLVTGAVEAWKDLLTLSPPAGAFVGPAIVPYLAGLLASVAAVTTALRTTRRQAWALVPVAALGLVGVLWGSQNAPLALPAAGTALAALHASARRLPADLAARLPGRRADGRRAGAVHASVLRALDPALAARALALDERLPADPPAPRVLSHGDFTPDQVLVRLDDGAVWLTDFERSRLAPAATDLGSYLAVVDDATARALLDGYADAGGRVPDRADLAAGAVRARLERLAEPLRHADARWRERIGRELEELEETCATR